VTFSLVVVGFVLAAIVTHGFRDEESYQMGRETSRHGVARSLYNSGQAAKAACEAGYQMEMYSLPPRDVDRDDYMDGCLDGLRR
jgi:hypothetical protein